jgi:hypothetical protein
MSSDQWCLRGVSLVAFFSQVVVVRHAEWVELNVLRNRGDDSIQSVVA